MREVRELGDNVWINPDHIGAIWPEDGQTKVLVGTQIFRSPEDVPSVLRVLGFSA